MFFCKGKEIMIEEISKQAQNVIESYNNLRIGGKKVIAPYFMNIKKKRGELRVMVGKGTPEEIEQEAKVWAQVKGFNLKKASPEQIREFLMQMDIGIDCSGFAVYVLNAELDSRGLNPIWTYLHYQNNSIISKLRRLLRPAENVGANTLTNEDNCVKIEDWNDIEPADLIRAKGKQKNAHHVAIITKVHKDKGGNVKSFNYAHSHRYYEDENGIREGKVEIIHPKGELKDQRWDDDYKGRNYMLEDLLVDYEDNGIRRLKILLPSSSTHI